MVKRSSGSGRGAHADFSVDSDALRANISGTALEVTVPSKYEPLIRSVEGLYGVRSKLLETLQEYFHDYRNIDTLLEGFQTTLLRNWSYFESSDDRSNIFSLFTGLLCDLMNEPLSPEQMSALLHQVLMWAASCAAGRHSGCYHDSLLKLAASFSKAAGKDPTPFLGWDSLLSDLVRKAAAHPDLEQAYLELYRKVLLSGYTHISERMSIVEWCGLPDTELNHPQEVIGIFDFLKGREMERLRDAVSKSGPERLLSGEFPSYSGIMDRTIDSVFRVSNVEDRFLVCLYFLKDDILARRQNEVMSELLRVVKLMMEPDQNHDIERTLSRLTRFFRGHAGRFMLTRFQCYEAIGRTIGSEGYAAAADHLIEDILYWKFQYPDIQGATDDWETVVNPFHLPKIRCWMHIIESNPALYERLAAALNVQLRLGGVYIADTDLFQRDVTRFLNSDIRLIYFVAKQLLRVFPVYFNEVGAEGELRSVSTRIDEMCSRRDSLMHFLRKQIHAESSNRLVSFCREVMKYWATLDTDHVEPYLSAGTLAAIVTERQWAEGPHGVLSALRDDGEETDGLVDRVLGMDHGSLKEAFTSGSEEHEFSLQRVAMMARLHQLLDQKYYPSSEDLEKIVVESYTLDRSLRSAFIDALGDWRSDPEASHRDRLIDASLDILERLKSVILDPEPSKGTENIYHKRHIAAGIPSMYGDYSEPKFDALGLTFRIEKLVSTLFEELVTSHDVPYMTRSAMKRVAADLRRFERALALDGINPRSLISNIEILEGIFEWHGVSFNQYRNVFQFLAQSVTELSRISILSHDMILRTVLEHDPRQCMLRGMCADAVSEMVLREVLVSAFGLQTLDRFVGKKYRLISELSGQLSSGGLTRMMNYDSDGLISHFGEINPETDDRLTLGFKGLGLKHLSQFGHNVPEGFVITTELFAALPAISNYTPLYDDTIARIGQAVKRLEESTGLQLGNPSRPLLLAIRSGAAFSMPGLMTTFVNVGINDELAGEISRIKGFEWTTWDSYRRFVQIWAMSSGVKRDVFDDIINDYKDRYDVELKLDFTPGQMRELALAYRSTAEEMGVLFIDDPFEQVIECVKKVLDSWNSRDADFYRRHVGIADEWGTAVVVQRMVFGNRGRNSGSGVTFTRNPREPYSRQVRLYGDFTVCSQGEDLVGGLVFPQPISETQRKGSPTYSGVERSLENDYPEIYGALLAVAEDLASRDYEPQEIEFTFESPSSEDLYILQKRAMVSEDSSMFPCFEDSPEVSMKPVATGIGVSGGAYSGRVAVNAGQIDSLLNESPGDNIILLRPDTVPEDITMITRVNGIFTARGGATSHAAVTAKRLGKTAVVDCHQLKVNEDLGVAYVAEKELQAGDWLSIDGRTGNIFLGKRGTVAPDIVID